MSILDEQIENGLIYLIICSRGPGSETMTSQIYAPFEESLNEELERAKKRTPEEKEELGETVEDVESYHKMLREAVTNPEVENHLVDGVSNIYVEQWDEGPAYYISEPMTWREVLEAIVLHDPDFGFKFSNNLSYCSAVYRAIRFNIGDRKGLWSSVNGWREPSWEVMPKEDVFECRRLFDLTEKEILTCHDDVLRQSAVADIDSYKGC